LPIGFCAFGAFILPHPEVRARNARASKDARTQIQCSACPHGSRPRASLSAATAGCAQPADTLYHRPPMLIPSDPVHAFVDYPDVPVPNAATGPLAGLAFAVKDIFDVAGYVTGCGSPEMRAESPPATRHAPARRRRPSSPSRLTGGTSTTARRSIRRRPAGFPAARRRVRRRRSRPTSSTSPSAPTPVARCAGRRRSAAS